MFVQCGTQGSFSNSKCDFREKKHGALAPELVDAFLLYGKAIIKRAISSPALTSLAHCMAKKAVKEAKEESKAQKETKKEAPTQNKTQDIQEELQPTANAEKEESEDSDSSEESEEEPEGGNAEGNFIFIF